jgi:hypothetical protein
MQDLQGKSDEEVKLALEEAELEYDEIRKSGRSSYSIDWKLDYIRGELLRRKLKLHEKKLQDLVKMTQDSIQNQTDIVNDWNLIKKGADHETYLRFKKQCDYEHDLQTAIHLQMNQRPTSAASTYFGRPS